MSKKIIEVKSGESIQKAIELASKEDGGDGVTLEIYPGIRDEADAKRILKEREKRTRYSK